MKEIFKAYSGKIGVRESFIVLILGVMFLIISLLGIAFDKNGFEIICFFGLVIGTAYGVLTSISILRNRKKYNHLIPFLYFNWFIGCFAVNIFLPIFENLFLWVYVVTFLFCITNFIVYIDVPYKRLNNISFLINGISFTIVMYYMLYLVPFVPFSVAGIIALGLGFYGVVPLVVFVSHLVKLYRIFSDRKKEMLYFISGFTSVIIGVILFIILLNNENNKLKNHLITKTFDVDNDIPNYIKIGQNLSPNFLNEIILKKDLVYISNENFLEFDGFNGMWNVDYNERKSHNPIINLAYMFLDDNSLSVEDRVKILKSNFDKRLEAEEQLWSGEDLITKHIKEDVKVYSNERLAYTEITMDVMSDCDFNRNEEAIYSFQLPEGSVATSLSLWVNGMERKGVLTTKEKAKAAYNQIVGVEARDPSLMQWREGNRVVVRVFPVSKDLPRTFKCGFTTPLKVDDKKLVYSSIQIKGPNLSNAETLSRLQIAGDGKPIISKNFDFNHNFYLNDSKGLDSWTVELPVTENYLNKKFNWKNNSYQIEDLQKERITFLPNEIILDLNKFWSEEELIQIIINSRFKFYYFNENQKLEINSSNYKEVLKQFETLQYSLLPFYKMNDNSLIITKNGQVSANFEELDASKYLEKIKEKTKQKQLKVISINSDINPFWQTLKEQNYVTFLQTDLKHGLELLNNNQFEIIKQDENVVSIEPAQISIKKIPSNTNSSSSGSNHIYRMFAFGKVLEEQVKIQNDSLTHNKYVDLAKDANIVTPISSLIVLETDEDYKKHGIEKKVNTLGNASINNDGAVPEPYEWVLIILSFISVLFYYNKQKQKHNKLV